MKLSAILQLDCRKPENKKALLEALQKLPFPIDVEKLDDLELAVKKMCKKYPICLSYILPAHDNESYSFMIKSPTSHQWIKTIYSATIFEGYAKTVLFMYGFIQKYKEENA